MDEHTPLPWVTEGRTVYALGYDGTNRMSFSIQPGFISFAHTDGVVRITDDELLANATLIVTAVNSHHSNLERIERLEKALSFYVSVCGNTCHSITPETAQQMYGQARAALEQVKP